MRCELLAIAAVLGSTFFGSLALSLILMSRSALRRRLEGTAREGQDAWLSDHQQPLALICSLLRAASQLGVFAALLVDMTGAGESADLSAQALLIAFGLAMVLNWMSATVLGSAIARYAGPGLLLRMLPLLKVMYWLAVPLHRIVSFVDESVKRLTGANLATDDAAEAELLRSIEESQLQGGLDEEAAELIENVVEFTSTAVAEVMTPRTDIEGIELSDDLSSIRAFIVEAGHSRIPIYEGNLDQIVGILYVKDLLPYLGQDGSGFQLAPLLRQPTVVPETKNVRDLLSDFQQSEIHLAIVIDEYGGTAGLVTIEDVLEELVGEIHDEHEPDDDEEPSLDRINDARCEVDGRFHIDDLNEEMALSLPEDEDYDTIAGFVLAHLGRVPTEGESFETHNVRFTTLAATPTLVQRLALERMATEAETNGVV